MQPFYGDEPHIIDRRRESKRRYVKRGGKGGTVFAVILTVVAAAAAIVVAFASGKEASAASVPAKTWYYLSFYEPTESVQAQLSAQDVKETGGAGYVINDGIFHVTAAVYRSESDARDVAAKQTKPATVYKLTVARIDLSPSAAERAEDARRGFDAYSVAYSDISSLLAEFDRGATTESALLHGVAHVRMRLASERDKQSALFAETGAAEIRALSESLDAAVASLDNAVVSESNGISARLRYALCEMVYDRYVLSAELAA